jgi:hypothetical protein
MDAYIYQADVFCEDCGAKIRNELTAAGEAPEDPDDEHTYDSDDFPKGPYPDGGGEADSPKHCGAGEDCPHAIECRRGQQTWKVGGFLENPLTPEGYAQVAHDILEHMKDPSKGTREVLLLWFEFYDEIDWKDEVKVRL